MFKPNFEALKVTTEPVEVEFVSEPYVVYTIRGFAPVVDIQVKGGEKYTLFISPSSLANGLMPFLEKQGKFSGIRVVLKKDSTDRFAKYVVQPVD